MIRHLPRLPAAALLSLVVLAGSSSVHAELIYDSGVTPLEVVSGLGGSIIGEEFSVSGTATLAEIRWSGFYDSDPTIPQTDDFLIEMYDFSGASPAATPLFTFNVGDAATRVDSGARSPESIFEYSASLPETLLGPGRYLISIRQADWYWGFSLGGDGVYGLANGVWTSSGLSGSTAHMDFTLLGSPTAAVPEPSPMALLGLGIAGILGYARRRSSFTA